MFLTKKGFWKIAIMVICYLVIGSFCMAMGIILAMLELKVTLLFILGGFCFLFCPILILWGRYAEGKGKLLNSANKLLRQELDPAAFIKEYQTLRNSPDLVINKPSLDVLQMVAIAYDTLNDRENCLAVVEEMLQTASDKKKPFVKLLKASTSFRFSVT